MRRGKTARANGARGQSNTKGEAREREGRRVQAKEALARVLPATGARQTAFNVSGEPSLSISRARLTPFFPSFSPASARTRFLIIDS